MKTININLLGPEAQKTPAIPIPAGIDIDPIMIVIVLVGLAVSFGMPNVLTWGVDRFLNEPADRTLQEQKAEISRNKSGSQQLVERQKELEGLETDLKSLQGLVGHGGRWASILEELRAITPTDLWLTELRTDGSQLELSGAALDYKAVAYLYTNFQNARSFAGPILGNISEESGVSEGRPIVRFAMRASIVTPGLVE